MKGNGVASVASAIVKINAVIVGIAPEASAFKVLPNPTGGDLYITGTGTRDESFQLKNALGVSVRSFKLYGLEGSVSLAGLPAGVYILSGRNYSMRVVKLQ